MNEIQRYDIPNLDGRVESGPVQFNNDWVGVFFRGDNALHYAFVLRQIINTGLADLTDTLTYSYLEALAQELESCRQGG